MKIPKIPLAQTIVKLCELKGIKHVVISPGSRNAPLTIGFTNQEFFKCYSIVDERCAGFFALGIAQQLQQPVILVCTSGSALLNYFPAIAEAHYSNIPLIVLSADRPKYLIGIGDGQTINQKNVFGNHVLRSVNLKEDVIESAENTDAEPTIMKSLENRIETFLGLKQSIQQQNEKEINEALNSAITLNGPVHINIPFNEPLYETIQEYTVDPKSIAAEQKNKSIDANRLAQLVEQWNAFNRKMILVGVNTNDALDADCKDHISKDSGIVVLTETTSNLHHHSFFPSIDKLIMPMTEDQLEALKPDLLITFGGMIVSKKIKAFLRQHQPKAHWHIGGNSANDTFFCLSEHIETSINEFFDQLLPAVEKSNVNYYNDWQEIMNVRTAKHQQYLDSISFSDLKAFDVILKSLPNNSLVHFGNSSPIRYAQLFDLNDSIKIFCNRGTSGIDGCTSTAIGASVVTSEQNVLITGDLGFFYDSNALWNSHIPANFRIIVINNGGGGIFRILPGHKNTEKFDTYFETKHKLNCKALCEMYGLGYSSVSSKDDLITELSHFYDSSEQPRLLEIFTPRTENDDILLNYFKFIK